MVTTPQGVSGTVQSVNVLRQMVKIVVEVNDEKAIPELCIRDRPSTWLTSLLSS